MTDASADRPATRWTITSDAALLERYGTVSVRSRDKVAQCLSPAHREWIERSTFVVIASAGDDSLDCSPRGDAAGQAFAALDERHIAIPDRRGNNRLDTLRHVVVDPRVALLFLSPGVDDALRVRGLASISVDPALLERFTLDGTAPATVIIVEVRAVLLQNARAIRRAGLWRA